MSRVIGQSLSRLRREGAYCDVGTRKTTFKREPVITKQTRAPGGWPLLALITAAALPLVTGAVVWGDPGSRDRRSDWKDPPLTRSAAKRQRVLERIPGDPSVLVNVRYEHLPATGDMTLLGKAALPALERGLTYNVKPSVRQRIAWVLTDLADHHSRPVLRAALKDWNSTVRRQAVQGLAASETVGPANFFGSATTTPRKTTPSASPPSVPWDASVQSARRPDCCASWPTRKTMRRPARASRPYRPCGICALG